MCGVGIKFWKMKSKGVLVEDMLLLMLKQI